MCATCDRIGRAHVRLEQIIQRGIAPPNEERVMYPNEAKTDVPTISETMQLLASLDVSQNETHELISRLEQRLTDVLVPEPPEKAGSTGAPQPGAIQSRLCSDLSSRLCVEHDARRRLLRLIERLTV